MELRYVLAARRYHTLFIMLGGEDCGVSATCSSPLPSPIKLPVERIVRSGGAPVLAGVCEVSLTQPQCSIDFNPEFCPLVLCTELAASSRVWTSSTCGRGYHSTGTASPAITPFENDIAAREACSMYQSVTNQIYQNTWCFVVIETGKNMSTFKEVIGTPGHSPGKSSMYMRNRTVS